MTQPVSDSAVRPRPFWILWGVAALLVFPPFLPVGYTLILFALRLAAALVFLGLAYRGFRQWRQPAAHSLVQTVGASLAVVGGLYVAFQGYDLVAPSNRSIQSLIEAELQAQGADSAAEYRDLKVSDAECQSWSDRWPCKFNVSYTLVSTGEAYIGLTEELEFMRPTGKAVRPAGCEFNFQWSQRLRKTPYYDNALEPIAWGGCYLDPRRKSNEDLEYLNFVKSIQGQKIQRGISIKYAASDAATTTLAFPDADELLKDRIDGKIETINCEDVSDKPDAHAMSCFIGGTRTVETGDALTGMGLGRNSPSQVTDGFSQRVVIAPEGLRWVVKQ
ncbi:hypothetical protein GR138_18535 [Shinella kummerowiae]|uniref:Uncharacterized protein n=1 Tax=Shinella kummerowiae TaxID=417745 RepID=A0A6N8SHR5_9HYPH|nr:hypothetical protein [Shinella kummerowiae]MXN47198.1 hypothetical protein [Shinella kummerowiae]